MENDKLILKEGDILELKKVHPCGSKTFKVTRVGADCKIECQGCGRVILIERIDLKKRISKVLEKK